jgi:hypothetical protein
MWLLLLGVFAVGCLTALFSATFMPQVCCQLVRSFCCMMIVYDMIYEVRIAGCGPTYGNQLYTKSC